MMTHPDPEILTQLALNDPLALDAETLVHIADCPECTAEIELLQRTSSALALAGQDADLRTLVAPPDRVWEAISLEVGLTEADALAVVDEVPDVVTPTAVHREPPPQSEAAPPRRRRTGLQLVAAAVVGVLLGALGTWLATNQDDDGGSGSNDSTLTTSDLSGIDGHSTTGTASFEQTASGGQVTIELQPGDVGNGFIQAWLLDEDTGGMVALGVIDGDKGTFAVPPDLDLDAFNQIDISLEPYDGNPQHSAVSLARGPLP